MERKRRGRPFLVWVLIGLLGTLGVRGLAGGGQFVLAPSGDVIGVSTAVLAPTPVRDFLVPGLVLFVGLGLLPLVVSYSLYRGHRWAWSGAIAVGVVLTGWAVVEGLVIGFGERLQLFNLLYGIGLLVLSLSPTIRRYYDPPRLD